MMMHGYSGVLCTSADPYVAAMEFLEANGLPEMYLDQVAEFIVQNAGEYQGPVASGPADPFTGRVALMSLILLFLPLIYVFSINAPKLLNSFGRGYTA